MYQRFVLKFSKPYDSTYLLYTQTQKCQYHIPYLPMPSCRYTCTGIDTRTHMHTAARKRTHTRSSLDPSFQPQFA